MDIFEENVIDFIDENIDGYDEIHVSKYLSDRIKYFDNFLICNDEQSIIGDTLIGDLLLNNKTIKVFYNILYEYDDIEFKNNKEEENDK